MSPKRELPAQKPTLIEVTSVLLKGLYGLLGGLKVTGLENIPKTGGAIIAPNHLSWADPPAMRAIIRRKAWFMGNHDLLEKPVYGWLLPFYGTFPVDRTRMDREAFRMAEQHLQEGDLVCIFPEGGTSPDSRLAAFEGGVALLAIRNNVPIVPVAVTGTQRMLPPVPPMVPRYAPGGATITFGKPVHPDEIDPNLPKRERVDALTERLYQVVASMLPPEYRPAPEPERNSNDSHPEPNPAGGGTNCSFVDYQRGDRRNSEPGAGVESP